MSESTQPNDRLPDDGNALAADVSSGIVVFLVALPLCLGIALASNAPLFSGILAGIVGGLVVGAISGSHTSVSGPAAGLTAVVAAQMAALGSFEGLLTATVLAGALQITLGVLRLGSIADFVPTSVIKGLLAAIGLILILKQLPHLVGHDADYEGEMSFHQPDDETTFSELWKTIDDMHPGAAAIGLGSLALLLIWQRTAFLKKSLVPAPLVVVVLGVLGNLAIASVGPPWTIEESHLVTVPVAKRLGDLVGFLTFPDLDVLADPALIMAAITIAAVASLETLLNLEAVDKLDPRRRVSPVNRELVAQGFGNVTAGLIGGLPVTSVIVRSSVNINTGGRTKRSTLIHGALLLLSVIFLPKVLNLIPLSSLAAVLIVTGMKLAGPQIFRSMWNAGWSQFLPFLVTIGAILFTDLLIGILVGLGTSLVFLLQNNLVRPLEHVVEKQLGGDVHRIRLPEQVSFLNRASLSRALNEIPRDGHVLVDARQTIYIDDDVLNLIMEFEREIAPAHGVKVSLLGFKDHYDTLEDRVEYVDHTTSEMRSNMTPGEILDVLMHGNQRYRTGRPLTRSFERQRKRSKNEVHPLAVVFGGTSSRTPIEQVFDAGIGDLFCVRSTGNFAGDDALGSLEYASAISGAKLILVLGHTRNNAVRLAVELSCNSCPAPDEHDYPHLGPVLDEISQSIDPRRANRWPELNEAEQLAFVDELSEAHVRRTMGRIVASSPAIERRVRNGELAVKGAMYDVATGDVRLLG